MATRHKAQGSLAKAADLKLHPQAVQPMEAQFADELPEGSGWQFEPKWDGFRCLAFRQGDTVDLRAKSGKPLGRYFPDIMAAMAALPVNDVVFDGELVIPVGEVTSFDALQQRLHPARSRVEKLARETPATFVLFDILAAPGRPNLVNMPLSERRRVLEDTYRQIAETAGARIKLSPATTRRQEAQRWLAKSGGSLDGVVAKRLDGAYEPGERAMLKIKRLRTADCVVGGFRYAGADRLVGSLLLGLYTADGLLDCVGFSSGIPASLRQRVTRRLENLVAPPGFTGRAPGAPSRWSAGKSKPWQPLQPELVVEVCYDHVTAERFRHGTRLLRWRPDKAPAQCTLDQLELEASPQAVVSQLLRH